jgi:hypothetical protein
VIFALLLAINFVAPTLSQPGVWPGDEVAVRNGEKVLVLVEKSRLQCELEEQRVRVSTVEDSPDLPGDVTGKKVSLEHESEVVQIIARVPGLIPGPVETVEVQADENAKHENPITFTFHGVEWRIEAIGSDLVITDGTQKQVLARRLDKETIVAWDLYWAGDMDHDGKLDLLYVIHGEKDTRDQLALSSAAKDDGELVRVVAGEKHFFGC